MICIPKKRKNGERETYSCTYKSNEIAHPVVLATKKKDETIDRGGFCGIDAVVAKIKKT